MANTNKTYRIRANAGADSNITISLDQDYDVFEILSLKISQTDTYRLHNANYGVIVGRVIANNGFGVPNAKISVFIKSDDEFNLNQAINAIYPYSTTLDKNEDNIRYNLLQDRSESVCHADVGTFPNKRYLLDNQSYIEVFNDYYIYSTRTNESGDYMICGVPVGTYQMHMDLDISDCGILSQRPRDLNYKGYNIEQFESPNQFKSGSNIDSLSQIFTQDATADVIPFWGNTDNGENIGITRVDFDVNYTFEPTCVFIGSIAGDNASNGISKKCIPTNNSGLMSELTTGEGTIEMIRKTLDGSVEEFQIKGTQLINSDGVWCYQIPMNLDYMMTDEYGNMVPTDNPNKGIPTRTEVRFRMSLNDFEGNTDSFYRAKTLVPHNPHSKKELDYNFGTYTEPWSYRSLFWNNVYSVKSYIPRFQKGSGIRADGKFSGIKACNIPGANNPLPYNNIRIRMPLMFSILCSLIKTYVRIVYIINNIQNLMAETITKIGSVFLWASFNSKGAREIIKRAQQMRYITIADGICPDLENWYFAPVKKNLEHTRNGEYYNLLKQTLNGVKSGDNRNDTQSIDYKNRESDEETACITIQTEYLINCIEMALAQEYQIIKFDFYNDWVNGFIYSPRWNRFVRKKRQYLFGAITIPAKTRGCMTNTGTFSNSRKYVQQCALEYSPQNGTITRIVNQSGCGNKNKKSQVCHKKQGTLNSKVFMGNGGLVNEIKTSKGQYVYYYKPCEWNNGKKVNFFATDIILLGSLNDCDLYGIPQAFKNLTSSSYKMPTNLVATNMDEDGILYATDNGTMCAGTSTGNVIKPVGNTFSEYTKYSSTAKDSIDRYTYGGDDDSIPLSEAAGIAWNQTGPGQGTPTEDNLYSPGGHFLGLSCFNSQTNIKSCINLQRICEVGVEMSSRQEIPYGFDSGNTALKYFYTVPTGFISKDNIIDDDFRSMFATMNYNNLKTEIDETTGYPRYRFLYNRPDNFEGGFNKQVIRNGEKYNHWMRPDNDNEAVDEHNNGYADVPSYDKNEVNETYTRTLEYTSNDYYYYRMGLAPDASIKEQENKFLVKGKKGYALPQYENSFYFYFGLKNGATALDDFKKNFFAPCGDKDNNISRGTITIDSLDNEYRCDFKRDIRFVINNMQPTYTYVIYPQGEDGEKYEHVVTERNVFNATLNYGAYTIQVTDSLTEVATRNFTVGADIFEENTFELEQFKGDISKYDDENAVANALRGITKDNDALGGYFMYNNPIIVNGESDETRMGVIICDGVNYAISNNDSTVKYSFAYFYKANYYTTLSSNAQIDWVKTWPDTDKISYVNIWGANRVYEIFIFVNCNGRYSFYSFGDFDAGSANGLDLYLKYDVLPYSTVLSHLKNDWWNYISYDRINEYVTPFNRENAGDIKNAWFIRHALFNQSLDITGGFDCNVYAASNNDTTPGDIVLWGMPEKLDAKTNVAEYLNKIYSDFGEIPSGYDLNDGNTIIPQLLYNNPSGRSNFFKTVLNEAGDNAVTERLYYDNWSKGANSINITFTDYSAHTNEAFLVLLNDNTVIPVYSKTSGKNVTLVTQDEFNSLINSMVSGSPIKIFKTFEYPVFYRPFFGQAVTIFCDSYTSGETLNGGEIKPGGSISSNEIITYNPTKSTYGKLFIYNGVTNEGKLGDIKINDTIIDKVTIVSGDTKNSGNGYIWDDKSKYTTIPCRLGYAEIDNYYDDENISIELNESVPANTKLNDLVTFNTNVESLFYDNIGYGIDGSVVFFVGEGESGPNTKYYFVKNGWAKEWLQPKQVDGQDLEIDYEPVYVINQPAVINDFKLNSNDYRTITTKVTSSGYNEIFVYDTKRTDEKNPSWSQVRSLNGEASYIIGVCEAANEDDEIKVPSTAIKIYNQKYIITAEELIKKYITVEEVDGAYNTESLPGDWDTDDHGYHLFKISVDNESNEQIIDYFQIDYFIMQGNEITGNYSDWYFIQDCIAYGVSGTSQTLYCPNTDINVAPFNDTDYGTTGEGGKTLTYGISNEDGPYTRYSGKNMSHEPNKISVNTDKEFLIDVVWWTSNKLNYAKEYCTTERRCWDNNGIGETYHRNPCSTCGVDKEDERRQVMKMTVKIKPQYRSQYGDNVVLKYVYPDDFK